MIPPKTRADCVGGVRPCPWVRCRHHLHIALVSKVSGVVRTVGDCVTEMEQTCSLDVAELPRSLTEVAKLMGVTMQRIKQLEDRALANMRAYGAALAPFAGEPEPAPAVRVPTRFELMADAYKMRAGADPWSWQTIANWFNARGLTTPSGTQWRGSGVTQAFKACGMSDPAQPPTKTAPSEVYATLVRYGPRSPSALSAAHKTSRGVMDRLISKLKSNGRVVRRESGPHKGKYEAVA